MTERCKIPPAGWTCSRTKGHDGPCAADRERPVTTEYDGVSTFAEAFAHMQAGHEVEDCDGERWRIPKLAAFECRYASYHSSKWEYREGPSPRIIAGKWALIEPHRERPAISEHGPVARALLAIKAELDNHEARLARVEAFTLEVSNWVHANEEKIAKLFAEDTKQKVDEPSEPK